MSLYGLLARYPDADALAAAVRAARAEGYRTIEAFSPFPIEEIDREIGHWARLIPVLATAAGVAGAVGFYFLQVWMNAIDYPINVGGRPLYSWPAFLPATIIVGVLFAGASALLGMLVINGLPRLHHPVFAAPGFERASEDRFFLLIASANRRFDRQRTAALLARFGPEAIHEVEA